MNRPLYQIARDIRKGWAKPNYAAKPYLDAMSSLSVLSDRYICDSGYDIVIRFLGNSSSWRGECAKRIKAELKALIRAYENSQNELNS